MLIHVVFRILLLSCSGSITSVWEERANFPTIVNLLIMWPFVGRGFLFLLVLGIGCMFLL